MNFIKRNKVAKQRGFSNVQIAIGILVTVIALLGSIAGYQYVYQAKVNNELSELNDLQNSTVKYGSVVGTFNSTNVTPAILAGLNFYPATRVQSDGTTVNNQWGGTITPALGTILAVGDSIQYTYTGVTDFACKEMGTKADGIAQLISINGTATKTNGTPSDPALVIANCTGTNNNNTIAYTIAK